jgi:RimJ/RimL family protein N-acetyltransferase
VAHAAELAPLLDDVSLDEFPGGVTSAAQGRGCAKEAAHSLVALLHAAGWTIIAHIRPGHLASQRVARAAGLSPTGHVHDGEMRWVSPPRPR